MLFLDKSPISRVASQLRRKSEQFPLYGGDVLGVIDITESLLKNVRYVMSSLEGGDSVQIVEDLLLTLSGLLEENVLPGWEDLPPLQYQSQRTRFINVMQELGVLIQEKKYSWRRWSSRNIGKFCSHLHFNLHKIFIDMAFC